MAKTRILIVERHPAVVQGLRTILQHEPEVEIAGFCLSSQDALEKIDELKPELVVLDSWFQRVSRGQLVAQILAKCAHARVILFDGGPEAGVGLNILESGASGFLSKTAPAEEIVCAIRRVVQDGCYLDGSLRRNLFEGWAEGLRDGKRLSERERLVLRRTAQGNSMKEIAAEMGLSGKTVETYKARGLEKLGVTSRVELVRHAADHGWLEELREDFSHNHWKTSEASPAEAYAT